MDELEQLRQLLADARAEIADLRRELYEANIMNNHLSWHLENARENQEILDRERW